MSNSFLAIATASAVLVSATLIADRSDATPIAPGGVANAARTVGLAEDAQYIWGGRRYCWYDDGWRGPGWYWCGYRWHRGLGWGGPFGWNDWRSGARHGFERERVEHRGERIGGRHVVGGSASRGRTVAPAAGMAGRGGSTVGAGGHTGGTSGGRGAGGHGGAAGGGGHSR